MIQTIDTKLDDVMVQRIRIIKTLLEHSVEALIEYQEHYATFPSAKLLNEPEYSNLMVYKINKSYEMTRETIPELPSIE